MLSVIHKTTSQPAAAPAYFLLLEVGSFKGAPTASQETVSVLFQTYFFPSKEFFDFCTLGTAADRPLKSANKQL